MNKYVSLSLTIGLVVAAVMFNQGCGTSSAVAALSSKHDATYVGTGSVWNWALTAAGTFTATKKATTASTTASLVITGTYETFATGFYQFTVGTATSPDTTENANLPAAGTKAEGFAIPGVILLVKPGDGKLLAMPIVSTTCPTAATSFNWVQASPGARDNTGVANLSLEALWGNASLPAAAGSVTGAKFILDGTVTTGQTYTTTTGCTNGVFSMTDGFINMTSAGVGIVKNGNSDNKNDIVALPKDATATMDTLRSKTFVGLVFSKSGSSSSNIRPVNVTFPAAGDGTYAMYSDVATGTTSDTGAISLVETGTGEKTGFVKMRAGATTDLKNPTMWAAVVSNIGGSGRTFFFASGANVVNASGAANDPFAVIAVAK